MEYGQATIVDDVLSAEMGTSRQPVYDHDFELKLLHEDPRSGAEHYVVRYPPELKALPHRHSAAHTIIVLKGRLAVNDTEVGPGAYCHFPARELMFHGPAGDEGCSFIIIFDGPFDVEVATGDLGTS